MDELRRQLTAKEEKLRAMLTQRDVRLSEIEELRQELVSARSNRAVAAMLEQCDRLRAGRERIREQHANLLEAYTALKDEHSSVRKDRDHLAEERDQLRTEREQLRAERGQIRVERDQLRAERDHLRAERDHLRAERDQLRAERDQLRQVAPPHGNGAPGAVASRTREPDVAKVALPAKSEFDSADGSPHSGDDSPNRSGQEDDLKQIRGISRTIERALRRRGVRTLEQIACWTETEIDEIAPRIGMTPKRIRQEDWVVQARSLLGRSAESAPLR